MRLLIDIAHPAHVHFFKNFIRAMEGRGHEVLISARDKEVTLALLRAYGFPYHLRGAVRSGIFGKAFDLFRIDYHLFALARRFRPDLLIGIHNPYIAHVARLLGKPSVIFTDTENVGIASLLTYPFATAICTPACFRERIDPAKHVRYNGYKELAYLHPKYFTPDPRQLAQMGFPAGEPFIIARFISWSASHDLRLHGIAPGTEGDFLHALEDYGRVVLTSERPLAPALEKYRLRIPPEMMHTFLAYARLYIGEGGTMATEAAVLGTPAIHIEATREGHASGEESGNLLELRDTYGLVHFFPDQEGALGKALGILGNGGSRDAWKAKRERLLGEKIDVTSWMTDFIDGFPASFHDYRDHRGKGE